MLKNISYENFKSFKKLNNFEFKPITILCGTNSCGKSTIIQSLMTLKQTLESQSNEQVLLLNGKYVHLGIFNDIVFEKKPTNIVSLKYTFIFNKSNSEGILRHYLRQLSNAHPSDDVDFSESRIDIELKLRTVNRQTKIKYMKAIRVEEYKLIISFNSKTDKLKKYETFIYFKYAENKNYNIFWENVKFYNDEEAVSGNTKGVCEFINLFPTIKRVINGYDAGTTNLYMFFWRVKDIIGNIFKSYSYIGPLREEASRRYIYENEISEIGLKGENAAFLYMRDSKEEIKNFYTFNSQTEEFSRKKVTLKEGVNEWLRILGIEGFDSKISNEVIYLNLNANPYNDTNVNMADVGFGISQVFPIILEGLRISENETLVLEQPEIHLHPKMQMDMADYFLSLALAKKNVIIETHSEHIINRLVRRIIEDDNKKLKDLIGIYFITPSKDGSNIELINIDESHGIVNWPENFFDQGAIEQEKIILAGIKKRKQNKK